MKYIKQFINLVYVQVQANDMNSEMIIILCSYYILGSYTLPEIVTYENLNKYLFIYLRIFIQDNFTIISI